MKHETHPGHHIFSPSQLASQAPGVLADKLTEALRNAGDMDVANPEMPSQCVAQAWNFCLLVSNSVLSCRAPEQSEEGDVDQAMTNATRLSQFTENLLLFVRPSFAGSLPLTSSNGLFPQSQTQSGSRYTPHLTRFYASLPPHDLLTACDEVLRSFGCKTKLHPSNPPRPSEDMSDSDKTDTEERISVKCRVGGLDARRVQFKGYVEVESFARNGYSGSFCVFRRDEVRPSHFVLLCRVSVCGRSTNVCVAICVG